MLIAENILCNRTHEYVLKQDENYLVGITDYLLSKTGEIVFLDLPEPGTSFEKGEVFGTLQDVNSSRNLYMPISGTVLGINEELVDNYDLLQEKSWLIKISSETAAEDSIDLYEYDDYIDVCLG